MVKTQLVVGGGVRPSALLVAVAGAAASSVGVLDHMDGWLDGAGAPQGVRVRRHGRYGLKLAADERATQLVWQLLDEEGLEVEAVSLLLRWQQGLHGGQELARLLVPCHLRVVEQLPHGLPGGQGERFEQPLLQRGVGGVAGVLGHVPDPVAGLWVQDSQDVVELRDLLRDAGPPKLRFDWYEPGARFSGARTLAA